MKGRYQIFLKILESNKMSKRDFLRENQSDIQSIFNEFGNYPNISIAKIENWLKQFRLRDMKIGLKLLQNLKTKNRN